MDHVFHALDDCSFLGAGFHDGHLLVELVELRDIVLSVVGSGRSVGSVEQLVDVLCVRIIHGPTAVRELEVPLLRLLEIGGECVVDHVDLESDGTELPLEEFSELPARAVSTPHVEVDRGKAFAFGVARLGHEFLGLCDVEFVLDLFVGRAIGDARRHRYDHLLARAVGEDLDPLVSIDRGGDRLPEVLVGQHLVLHIDGDVANHRPRLDVKSDALGRELRIEVHAIGDGLPEVVLGELEVIDLALNEVQPAGLRFTCDVDHHAIDEGHGLVRVCKKASAQVVPTALSRVHFGAEVGVLLHHDPAIAVPRLQYVGSGPYRVIGQVTLLIGPLGCRFRGNRRSEGHRQHIHDLRVRLQQLELQRVVVERLHPFHGLVHQLGQVRLGGRE